MGIIYRVFMLEDLLESPEAPALMDPVLDAAARGEVKIFTPLDAEMYASKGALAMLSDEKNRPVFVINITSKAFVTGCPHPAPGPE